jgi:hypothetical protein
VAEIGEVPVEPPVQPQARLVACHGAALNFHFPSPRA